MTFPTTDLLCKVYLAIGADLTQPPHTWSWTEITDYVRFAPGITTSQGRPDWTSTVRNSSGQLTLDNRDGRFSRRNPNGPYFGLLTFNTPIWATVDAGAGPVSRLQQFVNEWPTRWDRSGNDSTVPIQCAGIMRRLQQGRDPRSAQRRALPATSPAAYWPIEDGSNSTQAASAVSGVAAMNATGVIRFASASGAPGSGSVADLSTGGQLVGTVPATAALSYRVEFNFIMPVLQPGGFVAMVQWTTPGGGTAIWEIDADETGLYIQWLSGSGATALWSSGVPVDDNVWHHVRADLAQNGTDTSAVVTLDGVEVINEPAAGPGYAAPNAFKVNPTGIADEALPALGHLAVWTPWAATFDTYDAFTGYAGELATDRIRRICTEESIPIKCTSGVSVAMGPQPLDTPLNILRDAEKADRGVLYEVDWGLGYQALDDRTNEPVALALDFDQRHIAEEPQPADDDQRLRNRWRVSRSAGSEAVAEDDSGPLGTQAGGPGLYDDSDTVNVETDSQLIDQAGWQLRVSTVDEDRWPSIALRFHGTPDLIPAWSAMPFGARMTAANPPAQVAPDTIDAVVEGWSERWDTKTWGAVLSTSPFSPYRVSVLAETTGDVDENLGWLDWDSCTLNTAIDSDDVTWLVDADPVDTTDSDDFPRNVFIGGEEVTVTACSGGSAPQTWTVTRSVNGVVKSHDPGAVITLARPFVLAL